MNEKNVCLVIKGGKLTAKCLAKAMQLFLKCGGAIGKKLTGHENYAGKGQQTIKQLVGQGQGVTNIEISDKNIKSFESIARKYGVDFAVVKDASENPAETSCFFQGKRYGCHNCRF